MRAGVREVNIYGQDIIWVDYQGCKTTEQVTQVFDETLTFLIKKNTPSLIIMSFRSAKITSGILQHIKDQCNLITHLIKRLAFVGVSKSKRIILKQITSSGMDARAFDSEHEAIRFLISG